jgi:hypothetical protein
MADIRTKEAEIKASRNLLKRMENVRPLRELVVPYSFQRKAA